MSERIAGRERPLLMSGPMVRACLDGRKSQTRRAINSQVYLEGESEDDGHVDQSDPAFGREWMQNTRWPYGGAGDRLWVRETWTADFGDTFSDMEGAWWHEVPKSLRTEKAVQWLRHPMTRQRAMPYPAFAHDQAKIGRLVASRTPYGACFPCGHKNLKGNQRRTSNDGVDCRTCKNAQARKNRARRVGRVKIIPRVPSPVETPIVTGSPRELYQIEKAKRQSRPNPLMDDAKRAFAKLLEDSQPHRKGRPKGVKNNSALSDTALFGGVNE